MSESRPAEHLFHLPPLAQLPRTREVLADVCRVLERALGPIHRFRRERGEIENDLKMAVGFHAMNGLDAARAVHTLSGTDDHAGTASLYFRVVFEALIKVRWMRKEPVRAKAYLDSEPFERYVLATDKVKNSKHWATILEDCANVIAANPDYTKLPKVFAGKNNPLNYKALSRALRMPALDVMADDLAMDEDTYFLDHGFTSLLPHTSVVHVREFAKSLNADGTVNCSTTIDPVTLVGYVARTATRTGEILQQALEIWPDGAVQFDAENVGERLKDVVFALSGLVEWNPKH